MAAQVMAGWCLAHLHETFLLDETVRSSARRSPLPSASNWAAISGLWTARELHVQGRRPVQTGQPLLPRARCSTVACHAWTRPQGQAVHCHHTLLPDPTDTAEGKREPFFSVSHCAASSGMLSSRGRALTGSAAGPAQERVASAGLQAKHPSLRVTQPGMLHWVESQVKRSCQKCMTSIAIIYFSVWS